MELETFAIVNENVEKFVRIKKLGYHWKLCKFDIRLLTGSQLASNFSTLLSVVLF